MDKDFSKKLDFKDTKFLVKIRDIHNLKKRFPSALVVFLAMKIKKNIQPMYQNGVKKRPC